jgi:peptidoglycan/xylan/chitin deacetylase (PgdA/CDA1 family)
VISTIAAFFLSLQKRYNQMKFYWVKTHWLVRKILSCFTWHFPTTEKVVYLTFDDGPTPEITDWTLELLEEFRAKATFFCIGENIAQHPALFKKIQAAGHSIGNHTYNHLNGWHSTTKKYTENVLKCESELNSFAAGNTLRQKLFRPPYGKITPKLFRFLRENEYKIVMWDVLSADFDTSISPEKCAANVLENIEPGSIIIFHDSIKASKNLKYALPTTLKFLTKKGYTMRAIPSVLEPR